MRLEIFWKDFNNFLCFYIRKSSLVRLLYRFYETNSGDISIGGQKIKDVDLDSLRRSIAIVPQVSNFCSRI